MPRRWAWSCRLGCLTTLLAVCRDEYPAPSTVTAPLSRYASVEAINGPVMGFGNDEDGSGVAGRRGEGRGSACAGRASRGASAAGVFDRAAGSGRASERRRRRGPGDDAAGAAPAVVAA